MRFLTVSFAFLVGAALAAPLDSPCDEGVISTLAAAVTANSVPISKTTEQEDRLLDRRGVSKNSDCVQVLHDHGQEKVDKVVCGKKEFEAFKTWSFKQAPKDHEALRKEHLARQDRWIEKKMGLRNNSLSHIGRKDIYGKTIRIEFFRKVGMLNNGLWWRPEKWLKKYHKEAVRLNTTQEFYDNKKKVEKNGGINFTKRAAPSTPQYEYDDVFPSVSTPDFLTDIPTPAPTTTIGVPKIPLSTFSAPPYQFSRHPDLKTWPYTTPDPTTTFLGPSGFTAIMGGTVWVKIKPHGPHSSTPVFNSINFSTETIITPSPSTSNLGTDKYGPRISITRPYPEEMPAWSKAGLIGPKASSRTKARLPKISKAT